MSSCVGNVVYSVVLGKEILCFFFFFSWKIFSFFYSWVLKTFHFMCRSILSAGMSVNHVHARYLQSPDKSIWSLESRVINSCEMTMWILGSSIIFKSWGLGRYPQGAVGNGTLVLIGSWISSLENVIRPIAWTVNCPLGSCIAGGLFLRPGFYHNRISVMDFSLQSYELRKPHPSLQS